MEETIHKHHSEMDKMRKELNQIKNEKQDAELKISRLEREIRSKDIEIQVRNTG